MTQPSRIPVYLEGVPETLLWTLYQRAVEAARDDAVLRDPLAVDLLLRLDYPFVERFGPASMLSQGQALRALCFDRSIEAWAGEHPYGTVVAHGEGLETQFWRVRSETIRWLSVDFAEVIALQRQLLPADPRRKQLAASVLDPRWMDEVDATQDVCLTAQGLLMYLQPSEVYSLVAKCADRFPGATLIFDGVPRWMSARTESRAMTTTGGFTPPPMPWPLTEETLSRVASLPGVRTIEDLPWPTGRGPLFGSIIPVLAAVPVLSRVLHLLPWRFERVTFD